MFGGVRRVLQLGECLSDLFCGTNAFTDIVELVDIDSVKMCKRINEQRSEPFACSWSLLTGRK